LVKMLASTACALACPAAVATPVSSVAREAIAAASSPSATGSGFDCETGDRDAPASVTCPAATFPFASLNVERGTFVLVKASTADSMLVDIKNTSTP
jgi:hypothetical protein